MVKEDYQQIGLHITYKYIIGGVKTWSGEKNKYRSASEHTIYDSNRSNIDMAKYHTGMWCWWRMWEVQGKENAETTTTKWYLGQLHFHCQHFQRRWRYYRDGSVIQQDRATMAWLKRYNLDSNFQCVKSNSKRKKWGHTSHCLASWPPVCVCVCICIRINKLGRYYMTIVATPAVLFPQPSNYWLGKLGTTVIVSSRSSSYYPSFRRDRYPLRYL